MNHMSTEVGNPLLQYRHNRIRFGGTCERRALTSKFTKRQRFRAHARKVATEEQDSNAPTTNQPDQPGETFLTAPFSVEPLVFGRDGAVEPGTTKASPLGQFSDWWASLPGKYKMMASTSLAFVICNMDKVNMSVAIIPMARDFGWSASVSGLVQSAFFYGYMLCQLPGGFLSTKFTGSRMLPTGVGLWSLATAAIPVMGATVPGLCLSRASVGLGEALAPAAVTDMVARSVPTEERSKAMSIIFGGLHLGSIFGLLLSPIFVENFGWQSVFYTFGSFGIVWVFFWESVMRDLEVTDPEFVAAMRGRKQEAVAGEEEAEEKLPWRAMLRNRPLQALMYTHFCNNWFSFTMLAWLPTYFSDTLSLDLTHAAQLSLVPPLAGLIISSICGPLADSMIKRGMSTTLVRKLAQCTAFLGPTLCLLGASVADDSMTNVISITSALGLASFSLAGLYCNHQDLSPKYASLMLGITNTAGALPGIAGVATTGWLLDQTGSWPLALFCPSMFFLLTGSLIFALFGSATEQDLSDNEPLWFEELVKTVRG